MQGLLRNRIGLLGVAVLFFVLLALTSQMFKSARIDLTESKLFTLSEGTKSILGALDTEVELTFYYSDKATKELPALRTYATRVKDLLNEFASLSQGKMAVRFVDPEPFSEEEDEATAAGLQGVPVGVRGDEIFFGLVGKRRSATEEGVSAEESIPFFQLDKEDFLEYDLAKLVYTLAHPEPPVVGIISSLNLNGGMNYMTRQNEPAWVITQQLEGIFKLNWLDEDVETITKEEADILLLVHPQNLSDKTLLAIDQFVLGGGRALVFIDPHSEASQATMGMMGGNAASELGPLLDSWGIQFDASKFIGDYQNSMVVSLGSGRNPVRHIGLLGLGSEAIEGEDVILSGLETINVSSAGFIKPADGATTQLKPLLRSSAKAMPLDTSVLATLNNPEDLLKDFAPTGEQYVLAARVSGPAKTAFPEGIQVEETPSETAPDEQSTVADASDSEEKATPEPLTRLIEASLKESADINVMIVADTDILSNRLWVQIQQFFGQQIVSPWADNGDFLVNGVDNLAGNADLISIRSRGRFSRPFTRVEALRLKAEEKFHQQQQVLQAELEETDKKLAELEQNKGVTEKNLLTPEQEKALIDFQKQKLKIRKELRDVQHQLDRDIEALGSRLKLINILLVPLLLTLGVLAWRNFRPRIN